MGSAYAMLVYVNMASLRSNIVKVNVLCSGLREDDNPPQQPSRHDRTGVSIANSNIARAKWHITDMADTLDMREKE